MHLNCGDQLMTVHINSVGSTRSSDAIVMTLVYLPRSFSCTILKAFAVPPLEIWPDGKLNRLLSGDWLDHRIGPKVDS